MSFTNIVDRRKNGKNKSVVNRNRFLKRAKGAIKKRVDQIIGERGIEDIAEGDKITIPKKNISEPTFRRGEGGKKRYVVPGNKDHVVGDQIQKPQGGSGQGGTEGSPDGEGEDDFSFNISRDEFLDFFFEDLELPDLVKTQLKDTDVFKMARAGFTNVGTPSNLSVIRSMRQAIGRQIALQAPYQEEIDELEEQLKKETDPIIIQQIGQRIEVLEEQRDQVPFIDEVDLRFNSFEKRPEPTSKAVMFCLMDVSASMGEYEKDLAKRFYILLYLFLKRKYEKVEVVFVRHTQVANEVDEHTFFHSRESGGTVVSSGLKLVHEIIKERFDSSDWNSYVCQASDGDNWGHDSDECVHQLQNKILPLVQYFAYIQIGRDALQGRFDFGGYYDRAQTDLWTHYERVQANHFVMKEVENREDIYPVFRDLFTKVS